MCMLHMSYPCSLHCTDCYLHINNRNCYMSSTGNYEQSMPHTALHSTVLPTGYCTQNRY